MSLQKESIQTEAPRGLGRRLLGGLGTSGLSAAMTLFGRSTPAEAYIQYQCCHLAYYPSDYTYCRNHATYIWYCSVNGYLHCTCCEASGRSGISCQYN